MSAPKQEPVVIDGSGGINNRNLLASPGFLREAVNVDISRDKRKKRRQGLTKLYTGRVEWLSGKSSDDFLLFVEGAKLQMVATVELKRHVAAVRAGSVSTLAVTTLRSDLQEGQRMAYVRGPTGWVHYSSSQLAGAVNADGELRDWAPETPSGQPALSAITGSLKAGRVKVAVTFYDTDRREGGTDQAAEITVTDGQGILMTKFPQPISPYIAGYYVYVGLPQDDKLWRVGDVPLSGTPAFMWTGGGPKKKQLKTQYRYPPQPGDIIEYHDGRFYVITSGNVLQFSDKFSELFDPDNVVLFPADVTMFRALLDGIYASADKTYWLSGSEPANWTWAPVTGNIAVRGTDVIVDSHDVDVPGPLTVDVLFTTDDGIMLGLPGGQVSNLTHQNVRFAVAKEGAALFRSVGGLMQYLTAFSQASGLSGLSLGDRAEATIVKGSG